MIIYLLTNDINSKSYVGKTVCSLERRWKQHLADVRRGRSLPIHNAIRCYKAENFSQQILAAVSTEEQLNRLETMWIILLRTRNRDYGYNLAVGGEGSTGKRSSETKERIRQSKLGNRYALGNKSWTGRQHTKEQRLKISLANRGKVISEAQKDAIRQSNRTRRIVRDA